MHLAHRPRGADDDGHAVRPELGPVALLTVSGGDVRAGSPEPRDVVVVKAPDVDLHRRVEWLIRDDVDRPPECDCVAGAADGRGIPRAEDDDVVVRPERSGILDRSDAQRGAAARGTDQRLEVRRGSADRDASGEPDDRRQVVRPLVVRPGDDPQPPAPQGRESPSLGVRGFHAGPRLGQRRLRIAHPVVDGDHVRPVVGREDLRTDDVVLDQAARDRVAVGRAAAVDVDIGLDREALTGREAITEIISDLDHRDRCLVAEPGRVGREVPAVELRVLGAEAQKLHVGEAQADGVDPNEELVGARPGNGDSLGPSVAADVVDARAVNVPRKRGIGRLFDRRAIHGRHFGLGRSAAFRIFPVASMIPTFDPIVLGLAKKRSPPLIAIQR